MKFRCIYCAHDFEATALPPACPACAVTFTMVVKPKTRIFDLAMAVDRNGYELDANLVPRRSEDAPPVDFALAVEPDTEPRAPGCACLWEAGDSPCPVHGDDDQ